MSIVDGLAQEALEDWADDFLDGTLSVPSDRIPDEQGGWTATDPSTPSCKVLITGYSDARRLALGIPSGDRQALVLGASLPAGIVPKVGQVLTAPDPTEGFAPKDFTIIAKTGDAAAAVYRLQVR